MEDYFGGEKAMTLNDAKEEIEQKLKEITEIIENTKQNKETVKIESILKFFKHYLDYGDFDDGYGGYRHLWYIDSDNHSNCQYGFRYLHEMIDRIKEIDRGECELDD